MAGVSLDDVVQLHLADVTFPATHPLRGQAGQVFGFAVRHRRGVVLFDTGIGSGNVFVDSYYQVVHRSLEAELERHEHGLADVTAIVNSHLHFDHCGNNALFPGVPIYVQSVEYEASHQPDYTVPEWIDFVGAEYRQIDGDSNITRDVRIVPTVGHTIGHQSVVVATDAGQVVLVGQAIYSKAEYEHIRATGVVLDGDPPPAPESYLASARRLVDLDARRVFFSHDRETWERP